MAHEVLLPQWSMGMQDGQITRWLKQPGDTVADGEVIAEVESSKVASELLADRDGVFLRALVAVDELVPVRTALCLIGTADELTGEAPARPAAAPAPSASSTDKPPAPPLAAQAQITPRARKLAMDHGIDLAAVRGSGPGGRIVETDVEALLDTDGPPPYSLRQRRGRIAERLLTSLRETAQLTLTRDIDVTELALFRAQATPKPGWGDLIGWALGRVLPRHLRLNATVQGDLVRPSSAVHLGFAVALDDRLVTPVIRNADALSLADFTRRAAELTARARSGTLQPGDVDGGTFTVSNLGGHGIDAFTPIVNPPQVAILGLGRVREVAARDGAGIAWRQCFTASLTFDHRVTDGVPAAQLLADLAQFLATPGSWLPSH
ncbi:MAG: dihydrolipoamide acetyltransferase family protein [Immundisolibacter sp.]|uniref:dihydrolipoamide acetyltransferase family protein n=1 Tax=Immundisolibacter sp. TaxID=1934948 RepID=UPI003D0FBD89